MNTNANNIDEITEEAQLLSLLPKSPFSDRQQLPHTNNIIAGRNSIQGVGKATAPLHCPPKGVKTVDLLSRNVVPASEISGNTGKNGSKVLISERK